MPGGKAVAQKLADDDIAARIEAIDWTEMASALTSTSPRPGDGVGRSTKSRTSGLPVRLIWMAFMGSNGPGLSDFGWSSDNGIAN